MDIYLPATTEERCNVIRTVLNSRFGAENVNVFPSEEQGELWIHAEVTVPAEYASGDRAELQQKYYSEVEQVAYGALEAKNFRFNQFFTDQDPMNGFDCFLIRILFPENKGRKNKR